MGDPIEAMDIEKEQRDDKIEFLEKKTDYQIVKFLRNWID